MFGRVKIRAGGTQEKVTFGFLSEGSEEVGPKEVWGKSIQPEATASMFRGALGGAHLARLGKEAGAQRTGGQTQKMQEIGGCTDHWAL